jgi:hypothetical protein
MKRTYQSRQRLFLAKTSPARLGKTLITENWLDHFVTYSEQNDLKRSVEGLVCHESFENNLAGKTFIALISSHGVSVNYSILTAV